MTGSAKQSTATKKTGLLRRFAPRNDEIQRERKADVLRRWIYRRGPKEKPWGLPQHGEEGGQDLARAWRAGLPRMGGRGRQGRKAHLVPAQRQAQARRDRDLLLDHLQVARATRSRQRQGNGRQAAGRHNGREVAAVRRQADDLWRLRKPREGVKPLRRCGGPSPLACDGAIDGVDQHLGLDEFMPRPLGLVAVERRGKRLCEGVAVVDHALARLFQRLKSLAHAGIAFCWYGQDPP